MDVSSNAAGRVRADRRWFAVLVAVLLLAGLVGMHSLGSGTSSPHADTVGSAVVAEAAAPGHATDGAAMPSVLSQDVGADCAGCALAGEHDAVTMCVIALLVIALLAARTVPREIRTAGAGSVLFLRPVAPRARPDRPDLRTLSISRT
ncbi:DUF6153 family protein [Microbacterium thalassium]|uniref:Uncharacterized protein n=1 Tax=Microbacterium thalassium TaxID=362649 RepID=A0A7X0FSP2_9MICO|nr:DUF6153 family protein [Microbacterium thalassium]MBB6392993.1 hypothetical protein [Microbacterium thalassium]